MHSYLAAAFVLSSSLLSASAQLVPINATVPATCGSNYTAGTDSVYYTVPYSYDQVLSVIGNYSNLTWSGSPPGTVKINGTDNKVGTARVYDLDGAHVIETILQYQKPAAPGPYVEVHNTALLSVPAANVSFYIPFDGTIVSSACDGKAATFNFTAHFCANNATVVGPLLHMIHLGDAVTVGKFLGGQNYTDCAALGAPKATGPANSTAPVATPVNTGSGTATGTSSSTASSSSGAAMRYQAGPAGVVAAAVAAGWLF